MIESIRIHRTGGVWLLWVDGKLKGISTSLSIIMDHAARASEPLSYRGDQP